MICRLMPWAFVIALQAALHTHGHSRLLFPPLTLLALSLLLIDLKKQPESALALVDLLSC